MIEMKVIPETRHVCALTVRYLRFIDYVNIIILQLCDFEY